MGIFFNPNLPPNDSLSPDQIRAKAEERNSQTREMANKAYQTGGVPVSASEKAANHSSISRQTSEAQKAYRDAGTWWKAKHFEEDQDDYLAEQASSQAPWDWEDDDE